MPPSSYHSWHALYDPFLTSGKAQSEVPWDNCLVTCIFLNPTNTKLFFLSFGSSVFFCKPLPVHCVPFNWNIFFTSSLCILVTDLLICHIFGKTQSFQQTVWIFKWDVKPSTRKHKTESCDMLLLKRGGAYNTHPNAKMPSSLPFYTLTVFVLMTPGLWEGVGWPLCARLCRGISPGDSHRSTLPKEDEWRAALDTAQWGLPCAPPHTHHALCWSKAGYPGLCIRTQLCTGPYHTEGSLGNAEKQCLYLLEFGTSDPMGLPLAEGRSDGESQGLWAHLAWVPLQTNQVWKAIFQEVAKAGQGLGIKYHVLVITVQRLCGKQVLPFMLKYLQEKN